MLQRTHCGAFSNNLTLRSSFDAAGDGGGFRSMCSGELTARECHGAPATANGPLADRQLSYSIDRKQTMTAQLLWHTHIHIKNAFVSRSRLVFCNISIV
jgi:hypothetical protein